MLYYKNTSFSLCISQRWSLRMKITLPWAISIPGTHAKNGHIINFFKYSCMIPCWKGHFKQIQKNNTNRVWKCTKKAIEVNKGPEVYICVWRVIPSFVQSSLWWSKSLCLFWVYYFSKLYILALYLKTSIYPQLNIPTSILKIAYFISNYWSIMGKYFSSELDFYFRYKVRILLWATSVGHHAQGFLEISING